MAEDVQLGLEYLTVRAQWQRLQLTICLTVTTRVLNAMELAFSTSLTVVTPRVVEATVALTGKKVVVNLRPPNPVGRRWARSQPSAPRHDSAAVEEGWTQRGHRGGGSEQQGGPIAAP